jgi:AraC-like DNA-binding protein
LDKRDTWASYSTPSSALLERSLACLGAGEQSGRMEPFSGRALDCHAVVLITSGRGEYTHADGTKEPVEAPAVIWIRPGVRHGYGPDPSGWTEHWLLYGGPAAGVYADLGAIAPEATVRRLPRAPVSTARLFDELRTELARPGTGAQLRASIAVQRVIEAIIAEFAENDLQPGHRRLLYDLESGAFAPGSVPERARQLGISTRELREAVRGATGLTPLEFILTVRLDRARTLLAGGRLDVGQIATAVGFDDPAYFSRLFSQRMGMSPSEFRRQQNRTARQN